MLAPLELASRKSKAIGKIQKAKCKSPTKQLNASGKTSPQRHRGPHRKATVHGLLSVSLCVSVVNAFSGSRLGSLRVCSRFLNSKNLVRLYVFNDLRRAAGPVDDQLVDGGVLAQAEVRAWVALRKIPILRNRLNVLVQVAGNSFQAGAKAIAIALACPPA